ncbi:hypothetical protein DL93DRAFT_2081080 [Clavulina sp. PMI_390]|nr:hypothetical protein DL93DRAFT_2081080 [Clavulina sp. PMI_390]
METPPTQLVLFARGVIAILNAWPVMRIAVQESWGGPESRQKRTWIASTIVDAFEQAPLDEEQVEDHLLEAMVDEFEAEIDDGSSLLVAKDIMTAWRAASVGDVDSVIKLEATANKLAQGQMPASRSEGNGDDDWEDEDDNEEEAAVPQLRPAQEPAPRSEPVIDEDGFELVQKGNKRKGH